MGGGEGENENEETTPVKATPQIEKGAGLGFVEDRNSKLDREVRRRKLLFQVEILLFDFFITHPLLSLYNTHPLSV